MRATKTRLPCLVACAVSFAPACGSEATAVPPQLGYREAMDALRKRHVTALAAADMETYLGLFAIDVRFMAPDVLAHRGHTSVSSYVQPFFANYHTREQQSPREIVAFGDGAIEYGDLRVVTRRRNGGRPMMVEGKFLFAARPQDDGKWRFTHLIWNSNRPSSPTARGNPPPMTNNESPSDSQQARVRSAMTVLAHGLSMSRHDLITSRFTEDAVLMPPGDVFASGEAEIAAYYRARLDRHRSEVSVGSVETRIAGDLATDCGHIRGRRVDERGVLIEQVDQKYFALLRRGVTGWRIARLMWNANR